MRLFISGNPVDAAGQLVLVAGCDYKAVDGNAALFQNAAGSWPGLAGASPYLVGSGGNQPIPQVQQPGFVIHNVNAWFPAPILGPVVGVVVAPTGVQKVSFDLTAIQTTIRPSPTPTDLYGYAVWVQLPSGDMVPLQTGPMQILGVQFMNVLRAGVAYANLARKACFSDTVLFRRNVSTVTLQATAGQNSFEIDGGLTVRLENDQHDWIVWAADLVLDGQVTLPQRGDTLVFGNATFEVQSPDGAIKPYSLDATGQELRIHTKRVA